MSSSLRSSAAALVSVHASRVSIFSAAAHHPERPTHGNGIHGAAALVRLGARLGTRGRIGNGDGLSRLGSGEGRLVAYPANVDSAVHLNVAAIAPGGSPRILYNVGVGSKANNQNAVVEIFPALRVVVDSTRVALEARRVRFDSYADGLRQDGRSELILVATGNICEVLQLRWRKLPP